MNAYRQNELLRVVKATALTWNKEGGESHLVYKNGKIVLELDAKLCEKCHEIHTGECAPRVNALYNA